MLANTFTRSIRIGLQVVGVWPDAPYMIISRLICFTSILAVQIFQFHHVVSHFRSEDLSPLMDVLSATLAYTLFFIKLMVFWTKKRTLHDTIAIITNDWQECEHADDALCNMISVTSLSHRFSNLIIGLHSVTVVFYAIGVVALYGNRNDKERQYILKMDLPFESSTSPAYELVLITQFVHQMTAATVNGALTALLVTLVLHAGGQIDILRERLLEILPNDRKPTVSVHVSGSLIRRHQSIILFTEKIEDLYSQIALAQFISNTIVIGCLGFIIVKAIGDERSISMLLRSLLFYVVINLEAFIFCFAGEYLSIKSQMIGDAAYESLWYDLKPSECRILLLLIMRSQKQLTITVGKFTNLSLQQFANIVKSSASYISVLHAF